MFSLFSTLFLVLSQLIAAAPIQPDNFIVVRPQITYPTAGVVLYTGSPCTVTWLTKDIPDEAKNYHLTLLIGYEENNSENLDNSKCNYSLNLHLLHNISEHPLATHIPIMSGKVEITVPLGLPKKDNYIFVRESRIIEQCDLCNASFYSHRRLWQCIPTVHDRAC